MGIAWALGRGRETIISIGPKSVTAPVAMGISDKLGGLPSLTAVLVIATGILGAALGPLVLNLVGVKDWAARGFAMGTGAHGIGTARALQVNEVAGAFAGLAMGLNALATAILLPLAWSLFGRKKKCGPLLRQDRLDDAEALEKSIWPAKRCFRVDMHLPTSRSPSAPVSWTTFWQACSTSSSHICLGRNSRMTADSERS
jgi:hypothetical protein